MKQLFNVTMEMTVIVVAESRVEAEQIARSADIDLYDIDYQAMQMTYMPNDWDGTCLPYADNEDNDDEEKTVQAWIDEGAAPEFVNEKSK